MLNKETINKISEMKLYGMLQAYEQYLANEHTQLSATESLAILIDHEYLYRKNKKQQRLLAAAKLRFKNACVEDISYAENKRHFNKQLLQQLLTTEWLDNHSNVILTDPTGVGKTYLACAIAHNVCRKGYSAQYYKLSKLLEILRIAKADGSYLAVIEKLQKINCIIIDDWGIEPIPDARRAELLDLIDDGYKRSSFIITTQLPIEHWHDYIGNATIADAILDRLVHNAISITINGESMRKQS